MCNNLKSFLTNKEQVIFDKHFIECKTMTQTGQEIGRTLSSVSRSVKKIREKLNECVKI